MLAVVGGAVMFLNYYGVDNPSAQTVMVDDEGGIKFSMQIGPRALPYFNTTVRAFELALPNCNAKMAKAQAIRSNRE